MLDQVLQQEVSQRLLAESLRGKNDLEFRHLLEELPAGAYMCDPEGLITYYNPRAVQFWGRAPKLYHPEDRYCGSFKLFSTDGLPIRHDQCWMALALTRKSEYNGREIIVERPDGSRVYALAHANPIWGKSGELLGAVNVLVDITDRKRAEEALRQAHDELEKRVAERTAALAASNQLLQHEIKERKQAEELARRLSQRLLRAEEEERKRLSRELHDSVGQMTSALLINLSLLQRALPPDNETLLADVASAHELVYKIYDELRSVSHSLRPPELEVMGLDEALSELCQELSKFTRQSIVYHGTPIPPLPDVVTITFYRFVQEALNNAVKHACANCVRVLLECRQNWLSVTVEDDGRGFDVSAALNNGIRGIGLMSMRERVEMLHGKMSIHSAPDRGSRLVATCSLAT